MMPRESGVAGFDEAIHRGRDIGGGEGRAVLPHCVGAEVEGPHVERIVGRPAGGQAGGGDVTAAGIAAHQGLETLRADVVGAEVQHVDRIEGARWCLDPHDQRAAGYCGTAATSGLGVAAATAGFGVVIVAAGG